MRLFTDLKNRKIIFTLCILFLLSIYFPKYIILNDQFVNTTGTRSDFLIVFLYLSDIIIICAYIRGVLKKQINWLKSAYLIPFLLLLEHAAQNTRPDHNILSIYYAYIIVLGFVTYETTKYVLSNELISTIKIYVLHIFIVLSVIQAIIGISQFYLQHSVGLFHVGEQNISRDIAGVAKIDTLRGKVIRSYGTFTHPNTLAPFLLTGWIALIYLYSRSFKTPKLFLVIQSVVLTGLFFTFSRGALLCWLSVELALLIFVIIKKFHLKQLLTFLGSGVITMLILGVGFNNVLARRVQFADASLALRENYSQIASKLIGESPYFGVGPGQTMFQMKHILNNQLRDFEIQPIHNYFLQLWVEWGAFVLGAVVLFFASIYSNTIKTYLRTQDLPTQLNLLLYILLLTSFYCLMFFDHYFYTTRAPIALLWIVLALNTSVNKKDSQIVSPETN